MRTAVVGVVLAVLATGSAGGQEKKGEGKYLPVKELDKQAKAALEAVKKREPGYVDKGIVAFGEVITKADPKSQPARFVASQAAFFMGRLYDIKSQSAATDEEREKIATDRQLWANSALLSGSDRERLAAVWEMIRRDWSLEDMKKK